MALVDPGNSVPGQMRHLSNGLNWKSRTQGRQPFEESAGHAKARHSEGKPLDSRSPAASDAAKAQLDVGLEVADRAVTKSAPLVFIEKAVGEGLAALRTHMPTRSVRTWTSFMGSPEGLSSPVRNSIDSTSNPCRPR